MSDEKNKRESSSALPWLECELACNNRGGREKCLSIPESEARELWEMRQKLDSLNARVYLDKGFIHFSMDDNTQKYITCLEQALAVAEEALQLINDDYNEDSITDADPYQIAYEALTKIAELKCSK